MSKKILILGSTGMLGHQVVKYFLQYDDYIVYDIAFKTKFREETIILDVRDYDALHNIFMDIKPDFVVNCIGLLVQEANKNISDAIYINSYFPHQLKSLVNLINSKLIHISTDCVFSGKKGQYTETDHRDGSDTYARTKILGEIIDDKNVTLRTSLIGKELKQNGTGLYNWFLNQNTDIKGYINAVWSGVTTIELSKAIKWAIEKDIRGLYHITNNETITKNNLLSLFKKYTNKNINIIPFDGKNVDKSFKDTRKEISYDIPSYEKMISEMINND